MPRNDWEELQCSRLNRARELLIKKAIFGRISLAWLILWGSLLVAHLTPCYHYLLGNAHIMKPLEDTARYAGLLLAPAESFGLRPRLFLPFGQKKSFLCCFGPFLVSSSNHGNI
jgi:hypothetical protein